MDREELIERLKGYEWNDVEFKEARHAVPKDAYETVSAFANTDGGHLVFGVKEAGKDFEVVGVLSVDKVQGDFLTTLRQRDKISVVLDVEEELHRQGNADLLVFFVPEASRAEKPVYLNGDIRRSFVRRGGSDVRCSDNERDRFLIDATAERFDGRVVQCDPDTAFDSADVRWYRETYERRPGNRSHADLSDLDFLGEMGLLAQRDGRRTPTQAAVLLFGCNEAFRQLLPRPVVDCQRFTVPRDQADTGARWMDRTVLDENLIRSWRALVDWYERFAEHPFRIDSATLQRDDTPPDYLAYRESLVNLLIHQDYSDHARKPEIRHYVDPDRILESRRCLRYGRRPARARREGASQSPNRDRLPQDRVERERGVGAAGRLPKLAAIGKRAAPHHQRQGPEVLRARPAQGGVAVGTAAPLPGPAWGTPHRRAGACVRFHLPGREGDPCRNSRRSRDCRPPRPSRSRTAW